jgi:glycosyltransferase involved in cell wall biosynthesis
MRVTFICPAFDLSGGQRVVATYAERLRRRGHRVFVVAPPHPPASAREVVRSLLRRREWPARPTASHFDGTAVARRTLDRPRPVTDADVPDADVVIATWWETAEWMTGLSPAKGVKVHFVQDYEIWGGPRERIDATCALPVPKIVVARWVGKLLTRRFGTPDVTLVPNSVDTAVFEAPPRGKQARPTVGLMYTTFRNKGCDISIAAFNAARREIPDLRLVAFGTNRPTTELPLPEPSEFRYRVPDGELSGLYARCDAWLFGTRVEGFGLPILEAMACRTPVIGTPAGAAPVLLARGGGYLVRPEDPGAIAAAIVRVCRLPDAAWRAMSDAAYATATGYTWDDATDLFEGALAAAAPRAACGPDAPRREGR